MRQLTVLPAAKLDLIDIAEFIAWDNPDRAGSFTDDIDARCLALLDFPGTGRSRAELANGLHSKPHGDYVIFYSFDDAEVRIERVLHGARDLAAIFASPS